MTLLLTDKAMLKSMTAGKNLLQATGKSPAKVT